MNIQGIGQQFTNYWSPTVQRNTQNTFDLSNMSSTDSASTSEEIFSTIDTDSDGQLSMEEFESMLANSSPPPPMATMDGGQVDTNAIFQEEDTDEDGMISAEESKLSAEMFSNIDADGDGQITAEEIEESLADSSSARMGPPPMGGAMGAAPPDIDTIFQEEDTDEDGMISAEESKLSEEMFSNIDADGDGQITAEEIEESVAPENNQQSFRALAMMAYQNSIQSFSSTYSDSSSISSFLGSVA